MEQPQLLQESETNISILSTDPDKIEKYNALLKKVIHIIHNSSNKMEKRTGYDFNVLLKTAINETNNSVFLYLNEAIEHVIRHFAQELDNFISGKENWEIHCHPTYELLHDFARVIMQSLLHKDHLPEFRKFCLEL